MSALYRSLRLFVPLIAFIAWGVIHSPEKVEERVEWVEVDITIPGLPPLPDWATDALPDFARFQDTTEKKIAFFNFLYPRIVLANSRILMERNYLLELQRTANADGLHISQLKWLQAQAERLRATGEPGSPELFVSLLKRMDVIPPSLVLAQAANESAWGTSRFATQGNNLFGQWCFAKGCGMVPLAREEDAHHEVAVFPSPYQSVRAYLQNLNRHHRYQPLRKLREQSRQSGELLQGPVLAAGLTGYSERGKDYVKDIRILIDYNNLGYYDAQFADIIATGTRLVLKQLASVRKPDELLPRSEGLTAQGIGNTRG